MDKKSFGIGAVSGAFVVALGAFGAHGLKPLLIENQTLETYDTAVQYHMFHTLAILLISAIEIYKKKSIIWLFTLGIIFFSGSLYILAITGIKILGMITPIGGVLFIIAWIWVAWSSFYNQPSD